jgi:hypothetical protein|nr:MAG TPA: hypothetical protein [Ackermannviridae sp.]
MKKVIFAIIAAISLSANAANLSTQSMTEQCEVLYKKHIKPIRHLVHKTADEFDTLHYFKNRNLKLVEENETSCSYRYSFLPIEPTAYNFSQPIEIEFTIEK